MCYRLYYGQKDDIQDMKNKSVGINAILNVVRQSLSILFPLVTYPYALRVLGAEGIGKVNYGQSIVSYVALMANLGTTNYIVREGARRKGNKEKLSAIGCEVYTINIILTLCAYAILFIGIFIIPKFADYRYLIILESFVIIFTTLGIDWLNTIYEDFVRITIRSIITYLVNFVLLFVLVKDENDYYMYALLTVITTAIICISNRIYFSKVIKIRLVKNMKWKTHIKPLLLLFANSLAVTINTNFDITMLGWIRGNYYVGLYSLAVKVYSVIRNMICAIYNVAIPRLSYYLGNKMEEEYRTLNTKILSCIMLFVTPATIGLLCEAKTISIIMGGKEMANASFALQCLALAMFFSSLSGEVMNAMNISLRKERENLLVTALSAFSNIGLNLIFIPQYAHNGAALTTLFSEIFALLFLLIRFKNISRYIDIGVIKKELIHSIGGSILIAGYVLIINYFIKVVFANILIAILGSLLIYMIFLRKTHDEYFMIFIKSVKNKLANWVKGEKYD